MTGFIRESVGSSARSLPDCLTALLPSCPTTVDHKTPTHCVSNDLNTTKKYI
jgi:hypothetical protein